MPGIRGSVEKQVSMALTSIEADLIKNDPQLEDYTELPPEGLSEEKVLESLDKLNSVLRHSDWKNGKVSGAVYHGGDELIDL